MSLLTDLLLCIKELGELLFRNTLFVGSRHTPTLLVLEETHEVLFRHALFEQTLLALDMAAIGGYVVLGLELWGAGSLLLRVQFGGHTGAVVLALLVDYSHLLQLLHLELLSRVGVETLLLHLGQIDLFPVLDTLFLMLITPVLLP